jgi:heme exporter protein C
MFFSVVVGVVAFSLLYVWMILHRTRVMAMEDMMEDRELDLALAERRAEGVSR